MLPFFFIWPPVLCRPLDGLLRALRRGQTQAQGHLLPGAEWDEGDPGGGQVPHGAGEARGGGGVPGRAEVLPVSGGGGEGGRHRIGT